MLNTTMKIREFDELDSKERETVLDFVSKIKTEQCEYISACDESNLSSKIFKMKNTEMCLAGFPSSINSFIDLTRETMKHTDLERGPKFYKDFLIKNFNKKLLNFFEKYNFGYAFIGRNKDYVSSELYGYFDIEHEIAETLISIMKNCNTLELQYIAAKIVENDYMKEFYEDGYLASLEFFCKVEDIRINSEIIKERLNQYKVVFNTIFEFYEISKGFGKARSQMENCFCIYRAILERLHKNETREAVELINTMLELYKNVADTLGNAIDAKSKWFSEKFEIVCENYGSAYGKI